MLQVDKNNFIWATVCSAYGNVNKFKYTQVRHINIQALMTETTVSLQ